MKHCPCHLYGFLIQSEQKYLHKAWDCMRKMLTGKIKANNDLLYSMLLGVTALLAAFAVILQPDMSLLTGFWKIQIGHAGLITDPICTGGVGAALLNAAAMLLMSTLLVRFQNMPFTGP